MGTAQSKLDILIQAKNEASGTLKQIGSDAGGLEGALNKIGPALVAGFSVAAVAQIAETGFELARTGAQAERLGTAFDSLAGQSGQVGDEMLNAMNQASRGTIANTDLMLAANKAMLLDVADTGDEMAGLLEVASARGKAMGESTKDAFSDIIVGIGRLSPLVLDNLGIIVDAKAANEAYALQIGKVASALTEQEQKQALVNQVIASSTGIVNANKAAGADAADNFERMDASIQNAKEGLGQLFAPAVAAIAEKIAAATTLATEAMKGMTEGSNLGDLRVAAESASAIIDALQASLVSLREEEQRMAEAGEKGTQNYRNIRDGIKDLEVELQTAKDAQIEYNRAVIVAEGSQSQQNDAMVEASLGMYNMAAATGIAAAGMERVGLSASAAKERLAALKAQADETQAAINAIKSSALGTLESAASSAVSVMGSSKVTQIYGEQKERLEAQIDAINRYTRDADYAKFKTEELANAAATPFTLAVEAARAAEKSTRGYTDSLSEAQQAAQDAFNTIKSAAQSVLQGALDTGTGVNPEDVLAAMGLPREDAINENARRLADIAANGLKGQDWLGDFQKDVPDIWQMIRLAANPQEEAAHLLRDFQDGLLTSPIDRDKAKEMIRRQITGDANMAQMAAEIAGELAAEMGVPLQQALGAAQGALGVNGSSGSAGMSAAQSFQDGANQAIDEGNGGTAFAERWIGQIQSSYAKLRTSGAEAAKQWSDSFYAYTADNLNPALISLLANLVTPQVMSSIAQRGSLTGAVAP